ncbi:TRAP transporter substrate-binding protein [uncultured Devosia sp.]|uniref:TRAP transporter substrate-binding protein n=1 Tax=uncultured Devosia sp. TaxID=211434 RepID=UPI002617C88D|nr:TRAP transporter substrate-binding protein [uncultured Devosia sp.]
MMKFVLAAGLAALSTTAWAQSWDMPTPYGDTVFHTINIRTFADEVREATGGKVDITVHSAGSLFPHGEIKNAVRSGQVPIGEFFMSQLVNEDAAYGLDSQPFLATSYQDATRLWNAQKPVITELLAEQGLIPLFSVAWPPQGLYTNKEIASVDDLKGLRFRAYNAALEEFAALAGAAPIQVEAADIPQAFATGQVESMMTSPSTGVSSTAWDFTSHYTPVNAWVPKNLVVINQSVFDALDQDSKDAIMAAAAAAEQRGWAMSEEETGTQTSLLADNGMTIYPPSDELITGLRLIGEEMLVNLQANGSEATLRVLEEFKK